MDPKEQAEEITAALNEVRTAFNDAKRAGKKKAKVSTRALYLLTIGACRGFNVPLHDGAGQMIYDPEDDAPPIQGPPAGPSAN